MDRKTLVLMATEAILIVILVVIVALDYNKPKPPQEAPVASHEAVEAASHEEGAAKSEAAAETAKAEPEKTAVTEKAEAKSEEKAEEKAEAKPAEKAEEKHAEAQIHEKAPAAEEKKAEKAPEKAAAKPAGGKTEVADVIAMNNPAYPHTKGIVQFTHKKHNDEFKLNCGECHHNDKAEPLKDLKMGDGVQGCIECHSKPGKAPKPKEGETLSKSDALAYHVEALHENCIGCHKDHNQKNNTKAAPVTCGNCHPKK